MKLEIIVISFAGVIFVFFFFGHAARHVGFY